MNTTPLTQNTIIITNDQNTQQFSFWQTLNVICSSWINTTLIKQAVVYIIHKRERLPTNCQQELCEDSSY